MKKKYFFLISIIMIILLSGCGYEPVYSSKNFLFKIDKITHENNKINNQIARSLKTVSNNDAKNLLEFDLVILVTDHDNFDYKFINKNAKKIIDCRGKFSLSDKVIRG